ncbi:hypothetical protein M8818_007475 [Zalaria obscura]|uniref:Uncharacterized protein n=1 Tax=Zalaria obscura TaxID=2024903 RepID=A0ACC3S554_9PEZI
MEKIKQVFSPGHRKDDAVMYGEPTGEGYEHGGANTNKDPLHSTSAAEKDTGLKRQLLNPGNDKYDETRFGNTASTDPTAADTSGNISRVKTDDASTASIRSNVVGSGPTSATNEKISDLGSSSTTAGTTGQGIPDRTSSRYAAELHPIPIAPLTVTTRHDPNLGRDATLAGGAGAAGIAAREAGQRHHNTNTTSSTLEPRRCVISPSTAEVDLILTPFSAGHGTLGHKSALGGDSSAYPTGTSGNTGSSHLGRDAALAGGAGAAGVGAYEAGKHHDTSSTTGATSTTGGSGFDPLGSHEHKGHGHTYEGDPCPPGDETPASGYPHMTKGPHATDTANRLDPHIPGEFPTATGEDRHGDLGRETATAGGLGATSGMGSSTGTGGAGSGLGSSTGYDGAPSGTTGTTGLGSSTGAYDPATSGTTRDHHYGRDAGLAGAGAGAAGLAGYEYEKQRAEPSYATGTGATTGATTGTTGTTGLDSSTGAYDPATSGTSRDHHYGRDAGLAGAGAGAAGLAGYEYEKQRAEPSTTIGSSRQPESIGYPSSTSQPSGTTTSTITTSSTTTSGPHSTQQTGKDHHYGRDAAAGGTAGVAGDEIYNYGRKGPKEEDPASATVGPHKSNVLNVLDPRVLPQPEKMKDQTTEGPHKSDMMNRADPRVDSDLSKQNKDQHHYGRDAAAVGGTGAAGVGAYEYEKNKHQPGYDGTSTTRSQGYADPTSTTSQTKDHHYGRDAAVAGGAGAAGVGAYEYGKDRNDPYSTTATQGTTGTTSTARTQGYTDPTQQQKEHHYGRDAAVAGTGTAAAGGAAYEMDKHEQEKLEKARAKEAEKAQKAHEKDLKHDQKAAEKKHEKEYAAAEKKHEKQYAAAEKKHDKEVTAAEKKHEKELEKQEEKGEKKHGLFGFLHRNKDDTTDDTTTTDRPVGRDLETADKEAHLQHQRELEGASAAGTTGVAGVAGAEFEPAADVQERELYGGNLKHETVGEHYGGHSVRNKLHKEPPKEIKEEMERRSAELSGTGSTPTTAGDRSGAGVGTANY